ncbi:MAG: AEC family transporter [Lachnospiraceae bacterium]
MALSIQAFNQVGIMFLIILTGIFCKKKNIINEEANRKLSDFILLIVNPLLIVNAYQRDFDMKHLTGLAISIGLAIITHIVFIVIATLSIRSASGKKENKEVAIERFSCIYSNCGFMGIPLVNGLFGMEGVFYLTAYMTVFNIFIWTEGVYLMVGRMNRKMLVKTLSAPAIIATAVGFLCFLFQIRLEGIFKEALTYIASMNTPLAMIVAGGVIAGINWKEMLLRKRHYLVSSVKLLLVPMLLLFLYSALPIDRTILGTTIIAAACPSAVTGTLFAIRYQKNAGYASEIFAITTLLSAITIPFIMFLYQLI